MSTKPGYLLVQGSVTNMEKMKAYSALLPPIYAKFGGEYVIFTPPSKLEVAEGTPENRSFVMARFPSKEAAWGFWKSPEYEAAKKLREGAGTFFVTIHEGT